MYNGIGLQTARGSGTSGYIQSNVSLYQKKTHSKEQFLQELEEKRVFLTSHRKPTWHLQRKQTLKS